MVNGNNANIFPRISDLQSRCAGREAFDGVEPLHGLKKLWSWNREKNRYTIFSRNILVIFDLTNFLTNFLTHFWRNFDAFFDTFLTNYLTHFLTNHLTNFWRIFWPLRALGLEYLRSCLFTCFHKRKYFHSANLEN